MISLPLTDDQSVKTEIYIQRECPINVFKHTDRSIKGNVKRIDQQTATDAQVLGNVYFSTLIGEYCAYDNDVAGSAAAIINTKITEVSLNNV